MTSNIFNELEAAQKSLAASAERLKELLADPHVRERLRQKAMKIDHQALGELIDSTTGWEEANLIREIE